MCVGLLELSRRETNKRGLGVAVPKRLSGAILSNGRWSEEKKIKKVKEKNQIEKYKRRKPKRKI